MLEEAGGEFIGVSVSASYYHLWSNIPHVNFPFNLALSSAQTPA